MLWASALLSDFSDEEYRTATRDLSPSRRAHIDRITHPLRRKQSLAGELLARRLLATVCPHGDATVHRDEHGKPFANGAYLSIAHCDDIVVCAVDQSPVGIDVERIRAIKDTLIDRVCTAEEAVYVRACDSNRRFCEIWTAKEAYVKMTGDTSAVFSALSVSSMKREIVPFGEYTIQIVTAN